MLTDTFFEVLNYEGPVSITSWGSSDTPSVTCTWNSYLKVVEDDTLLIPAASMTSTQADVAVND